MIGCVSHSRPVALPLRVAHRHKVCRAAPGARASAEAGSSQQLFPLPQTTREMVREAAAAVLRSGAPRQKIELLFPINCRTQDFNATEDMVQNYNI